MCIIHKGFRGFPAVSSVSIPGELDRFEARNRLHILMRNVSVPRRCGNPVGANPT